MLLVPLPESYWQGSTKMLCAGLVKPAKDMGTDTYLLPHLLLTQGPQVS